jgi:hypothetical protein
MGPGTGWPSMDGEDDTQYTSAEIDPEIQGITDQLNSRMWGAQQPAAQEEPDWREMNAEQFFAHPETPQPFDLSHDSNDQEAWDAVLPERPDTPWFNDASNPLHQSRISKLLQGLSMAAQGGLAGRAASERAVAESGGHRSGGAGMGFVAGQQAIENLRTLAAKRQQEADLSAWKQAQIGNLNAKTAAYPGQQSALNAWRLARTDHMKAAADRVQAQADALRRAPADKLLHSYTGSDNRIHFLYMKGDGSKYEEAGQTPVYEKPIITRNSRGIFVTDPLTHQTVQSHSFPPAPEKPLSAAQQQKRADNLNRVEEWKIRNWNKITSDASLTPQERDRQLEDVQSHYENVILSNHGTVDHYDVATGRYASGKRAGSAAPPTPSNGSGEIHYRIENGQLVPE